MPTAKKTVKKTAKKKVTRTRSTGPKAVAAKKANLLKALEDFNGLVTQACRQANVCRAVYYKWYKDDPKFREKAAEIQEHTVDNVESKLYNLIQNNDKTAIIFYLKCKAKDRGYVERQEVSMDQPIHIDLKIENLGKAELKLEDIVV